MGGVTADAGAFLGKPASARITLPPLATVYFLSESNKKKTSWGETTWPEKEILTTCP